MADHDRHDDPAELAAYAALVGRERLTDEERDALDAALEVDPALGAQLASFERVVAELPPALDTTSYEPPATLRGRVLGVTAAPSTTSGRQPATRWLTSVAAAAVAVVLGVAIGRVTVPTPAGPPIETPATTIAEGAFDEFTTELIAHTWGTELLFTINGSVPGEVYTVTITAADGTEFAAGSFIGDDTREVDCEMNVALLRPDAAGFVVVDGSGAVVVEGDLAEV